MKNEKLEFQLTQSKEFFRKAQEDIGSLRKEKEGLIQAKKKLEAESVSYMVLNRQLQNEKKALGKNLQRTKEKIGKVEKHLQESKQELEKLEAESAKAEIMHKGQLQKETKKLEDEILLLESSVKKEKAAYYYNLAVAYARAKFYEEAVNAYEKSLGFTSNDPDTHYNLGLLYESIRENPAKALLHYRKYLELEPNAKDKQEVQAWIYNLETETSEPR